MFHVAFHDLVPYPLSVLSSSLRPLSSSHTDRLTVLQTGQTHSYLRAFALTVLSAWMLFPLTPAWLPPHLLWLFTNVTSLGHLSKIAPPPGVLFPLFYYTFLLSTYFQHTELLEFFLLTH